jgi:hypothetical protein
MKIYERILNVATRQWQVGIIEDHQARSLTEEELEAAIVKLNISTAPGEGVRYPVELRCAELEEALKELTEACDKLPASDARVIGLIPILTRSHAALADLPAAHAEAGITGRDVHREWRDGMLAQGRVVSPERMSWETIGYQDQSLDAGIAERLNALTSPAPAEGLLREAAQITVDELEAMDMPRTALRLREALSTAPAPASQGVRHSNDCAKGPELMSVHGGWIRHPNNTCTCGADRQSPEPPKGEAGHGA